MSTRVQIDYINPWLGKPRSLVLAVTKTPVPIGTPVSFEPTPTLAVAPVKPWGTAAGHPIPYPVKPA
jgi:hypothetical protein